MDQLTILKIGGRLIEAESVLDRTLSSFTRLPGPKILVHGGGKEAGRLSERLGIPVKMHRGRRITDAETLRVATMVYAGLFNKKIVGHLQSLGCNALGLSGADGNSILAHRRPGGEVDFGFVGDVDKVNQGLLGGLLGMGLTPVFCALTHDGQGQLLNTNADTIATEIAIALSKTFSVKLIYCFDKPGVLTDPEDESTLIPVLDANTYQEMKGSGAIHTGMLPKLENAFRALEKGAAEVFIGSPRLLGDPGVGTKLY